MESLWRKGELPPKQSGLCFDCLEGPINWLSQWMFIAHPQGA